MRAKGCLAGTALAALVLTAVPLVVLADDAGSSQGGIAPLMHALMPGDEGGSKERAHDAGVVEGQVFSVDRAHGLMTIQAPHARYNIIVLPSTTIQGRGRDFHTIADIHRGQLVQVFMSRRGQVYFAQIIHLRTER